MGPGFHHLENPNRNNKLAHVRVCGVTEMSSFFAWAGVMSPHCATLVFSWMGALLGVCLSLVKKKKRVVTDL